MKIVNKRRECLRFGLSPWCLVLLPLWLWSVGAAGQTRDLPRTSPEAVGLRSEQVSAFFDSLLAFPQTEIHSVIVMRHGKVVGELYPEPFRPEYCHTQFSCSKTFVAAAVGIAVGEGLLRLDSRLVEFFPGELPRVVSWRLGSITVEDLLTMRSGFVVDTKMRTVSQHWVRDYLAHPMNDAPGRLFQYDSIDTYLLSAIVQKVTGMTVLDYLRLRVLEPLNVRTVSWELSPEGIVTGGWGLYIQAESLAKFGQLLLQQGQWHGRQLIPAKWVDQMMAVQVARGKGSDDYGYQMWRCPELFPGTFRADGAYGQFIIVAPSEDLVVVINQCTTADTRRERSLVKTTLCAGMQRRPLPPSEAYQQLLLRRDSLPTVAGEPMSAVGETYSGRTIVLGKNPLGWAALRIEAPDMIEITDTVGRQGRVSLGWRTWRVTPTPLYPLNARYAVQNQFSTISGPFLMAGCYGWQGDRLQVKLHSVDWMGSVLLTMRFDGRRVTVVAKENYQSRPVSFTGTVGDADGATAP